MVIGLDRGADFHMAQLMLLPLTVSDFSKIQIGFTFLVPADLGSPGKSAVKWVCISAYVVVGWPCPAISKPRVARSGKALPSARRLSSSMHPDADRPDHIHTLMLMQFGQFLDHDMSETAGSKLAASDEGRLFTFASNLNFNVALCCNIDCKLVLSLVPRLST